MSSDAGSIHGRGAPNNPPNRFERIFYDPEPNQNDPESPNPTTQFLWDSTRSIITFNDSPDMGFEATINPNRGCEHGCIYCYARPSHEFLAFSTGLDFESRILVKEDFLTNYGVNCFLRVGNLGWLQLAVLPIRTNLLNGAWV